MSGATEITGLLTTLCETNRAITLAHARTKGGQFGHSFASRAKPDRPAARFEFHVCEASGDS